MCRDGDHRWIAPAGLLRKLEPAFPATAHCTKSILPSLYPCNFLLPGIVITAQLELIYHLRQRIDSREDTAVSDVITIGDEIVHAEFKFVQSLDCGYVIHHDLHAGVVLGGVRGAGWRVGSGVGEDLDQRDVT